MPRASTLTNPSLVCLFLHLCPAAVLPQISYAVSRVLRLFFPSLLPLFFFSTSSFSSSSPSFLLAISFAASASYPYASVSLLLTDRARYLLPAATAAKLKARTRVYTFRARLFTPCITMHAHVRIILSRVIHYQPILRASLEKIRKL